MQMSKRERERGRESDTEWQLCACPCLVQGFKKSGCMVLIRPRHTLSFSSPSVSLSVHVECLPGSIKGTGRQRSPTSKPSPLAVFSHTIRLHTHSHARTLTQEDGNASQKASLEG